MFFGLRGNYRYAKCQDCASIQLNPLPTKAELDLAYATQYSTSNQQGSYPEEILRNGRPLYQAVSGALRQAGLRAGHVLVLNHIFVCRVPDESPGEAR